MIPLFRTTEPELACNTLVKRFSHVLVQQHPEFNDRLRIRFRADMVEGASVYFDRVPSQLKSWQEHGGVLFTGKRNEPKEHTFGPHEAIVLSECPTRMKLLTRAIRETTVVGVIRERPNWQSYEAAIRNKRSFGEAYAANKIERRVDMLYQMRDFVDSLPEFSPAALDRLCPAPESSQSSYVRGLLEVSARFLDSSC